MSRTCFIAHKFFTWIGPSQGFCALSGETLIILHNVMGSFCKQHIVLNHVFFRYKSSGGIIRGSSGGCGVLPFCIGRTSFKLAVTSSNRFLPVVAHVKWTGWHGLSHHFRFGTLTMQMCCWIVDLTYSTLWLICALNYITKCYWSHGIILCIYWSGLLLWTSIREVV